MYKGPKGAYSLYRGGGEEGKEEVNKEEEMHTLSTNIVELYVSTLIGL